MKKEKNHLPDNKCKELTELVQIILDNYPSVAMIILFGSYARGNWVEEKHEDNIHYRYQSDFDILVVIADRRIRTQQRIEQDVEETLNQSDKIKTPVSVLVHDLDFINVNLARTQYFFSDIRREGILLYGKEQFQLQKERKLTRQERRQLAQEDFDFWFKSVGRFLEIYQFNLEKKYYSNAAFELHQATERLYTTALLVYTRYKPNTHDLRTLRKMTNAIDNRFGQVFLFDSEEKKELFNLLRSAYIDARYKKNYAITHKKLVSLQEEVNKLQALIEKLCKEKITKFEVG